MSAVWLLIGVVVGGAATYLLLRGRLSAAGAPAGELAAAREAAVRLEAELGHARASGDRAAVERDEARGALDAMRGRLEALDRDQIRLAGELERERERAAEKLRAVEELNARFSEAFKAMSADALRANNEQFLSLAKTTFGTLQAEARGELEKRHKAVAELVTPVAETLKKVDGELSRFDRERREAQGALQQQLRTLAEGQERLRGETGNLVAALRQPQTRGRWGEMQLRRVVELAGMLSHCDFVEQSTVQADGRTLRPDLVVNLPGGKHVVVDAKAPLQAYLDAIDAGTDDERAQHMRSHARQLREHMRKLGAKSYWSQFPAAPDFVVLFLPGEQFSAAALQADPGLLEEGVDQCVFLATPTTLITLLRAVAYGWQQAKVEESARAISELGRELHSRLSTLAEHVGRLGRQLNTAVETYNSVVGSMESRVLPAARKFSEHGAVSVGKELPSLAPVASSPRTVQVAELAGAAPDPAPVRTLPPAPPAGPERRTA
jgi:DNA recombination protein RmuC